MENYCSRKNGNLGYVCMFLQTNYGILLNLVLNKKDFMFM